MARKGKLEQRAEAAAEYFRREGGGCFRVVWVKNRTWRNVARIDWNGEPAARASGCGYDKLSAVVAYFLASLDDRIARTDGCGIRATIDAARDAGWDLVHEYAVEREDGFRLRRIA